MIVRRTVSDLHLLPISPLSLFLNWEKLLLKMLIWRLSIKHCIFVVLSLNPRKERGFSAQHYPHLEHCSPLCPAQYWAPKRLWNQLLVNNWSKEILRLVPRMVLRKIILTWETTSVCSLASSDEKQKRRSRGIGICISLSLSHMHTLTQH